MGAAEGDTEIAEIVAVDHGGNVVSPCGMCRELILDYSPEAVAIIPGAQHLVAIPVAQLLPDKYRHIEA
jgi:cytidine deaminase